MGPVADGRLLRVSYVSDRGGFRYRDTRPKEHLFRGETLESEEVAPLVGSTWGSGFATGRQPQMVRRTERSESPSEKSDPEGDPRSGETR